MVNGSPTQTRTFGTARDATHVTPASLHSSHAHTHRSSSLRSHCGRRQSRTLSPLQPDRHTEDARRLFRHRLPSTSQAPSVTQGSPTSNSHNCNTTTNGTPTTRRPMSLSIRHSHALPRAIRNAQNQRWTPIPTHSTRCENSCPSGLGPEKYSPST